MLHLVIMAGGSGTRFWPESRRSRPKQFLTLTGEQSLLQEAARRCRPLVPADRTWVVTGAGHAQETRAQLPEVNPDHILLEPCARNTAPCLALAAVAIARQDPDAVLLVTPADHLIRPEEEFRATVSRAVATLTAHPDSSVLIGIPPTHPATGYGYIERAAPEGAGFAVERFREKPSRAVAEEFLATGRFFWNSGMFVWRVQRLLELFAQFQPAIKAGIDRLSPAWATPGWSDKLAEEFPRMPSISVDYALVEPQAQAGRAAGGLFVVPASFQWDDVGSWQSLPAVLGRDEAGNTVTGPHCGLDTQGCVVRTTADHLVATIGLRDCVVVHTPDATLVAPRDDEDALRKLVARLNELGLGGWL